MGEREENCWQRGFLCLPSLLCKSILFSRRPVDHVAASTEPGCCAAPACMQGKPRGQKGWKREADNRKRDGNACAHNPTLHALKKKQVESHEATERQTHISAAATAATAAAGAAAAGAAAAEAAGAATAVAAARAAAAPAAPAAGARTTTAGAGAAAAEAGTAPAAAAAENAAANGGCEHLQLKKLHGEDMW
ncbi:hypothetical protein ACSSS7_004486 [Eimeria intestinalis]